MFQNMFLIHLALLYSKHTNTMKTKNLILALLSVIVFSCQDKSVEAALVATDATEATEAAAAAEPVSKVMLSDKIDYKSLNKENESVEIKIIKTAYLTFEASNIEATYKSIQQNILSNKAIIQNDVENKSDYRFSREMTIRIPSQNFDKFIATLSKGVNYFDKKEISSQDVTAEYIDTDARIASKKKLEARYLELLKKANKVSEMLEIEKQLSEIREEIESKEGQLKYLQNQVSMSTINLEFYKTTAQENGVRVSFFTKLGNAIVSGFNSIANFFINLVQLWPFILILVAIFYVIRRRILKKKQL
jgi:hypothetical protein